MGLCKCRTVTTLFCFEHRKNVCELCVVSEHPQCVVRSYLQWLQDSDFDPNCPLCHEPFVPENGAASAVRLSCFDLFHGKCLERELDKDAITLDRLKCPLCRVPVLPDGDSALVLQIRRFVQASRWASQMPPLAARPSGKGPRAERDPLFAAASPPATQPNGSQLVSIEIGPRAHFLDGQKGSTRKPRDSDPKVHALPTRARLGLSFGGAAEGSRPRAWSVLQVLGNCLMLRNVRLCSLGVSPRQTILIVALFVAVVLLSAHLLPPLIEHAVQ